MGLQPAGDPDDLITGLGPRVKVASQKLQQTDSFTFEKNKDATGRAEKSGPGGAAISVPSHAA